MGATSACGRARPVPSPRVDVAGRISLAVDRTLDEATFVIQAWQPSPVVLAQERQGVALGKCAIVAPVLRDSGALRPATATAQCGGEEVELTMLRPGAWSAHLSPAPAASTVCEVTLDGEVLTLPPVPETLDLYPTLFGMRWTPGDADELRIVVPLNPDQIAICRLPDIGSGPKPLGVMRRAGFATRQSYALPDSASGRIAISVASGLWLTRGRAQPTQ